MKFTIAKADIKTLTSRRFIVGSLGVMFVYLIITLLLPNYRLLSHIASSHEAFLSKLSFLQSLFIGSLLSYTSTEQLILVITGILIGMNMTLWFLKRKTAVIAAPLLSGQSLAGIISSGCASCGSTMLSAISSALGVGIAPFHLLLIQLGTILFLFISFIYTLQKKDVCPIPSRSQNR